MNVALYTLVFDHGIDAFLDAVELGFVYRDRTGKSPFALVAHVTHQNKRSGRGRRVLMTMQLLGHDQKRMHYFHVMYRTGDGTKRATLEQLSLRVNLSTRRVEPMPEAAQAPLARIQASHAALPTPAEVGHVIRLQHL